MTKVICLPFAGGSKYSFKEFEDYNCEGIDVVTLDYPGRGGRMREPLLSETVAIAHNLLPQAKALIGNEDYVVYGHSMGATVGFELVHFLMNAGLPQPAHLFVSGATGPAAFSRTVRNWHNLPKDELLKILKDLNGMPEEILNNDEFFDFYEPIIRADFKAVESYAYKKRQPLNIPITVMNGTREPFDEQEVKLWGDETVFPVEYMKMEGHHFFIFDHVSTIINTIRERVSTKQSTNYYG
ncbi:thioesterase [Fulvivirga sp. 29W222]|uniref:Thioesterase n=1 Tax=Fulvivirga marina TaxID=2494733 RepID=A0A937KE45_9BACT|nr:alpha/beta fold hydrolase [Fulvivirga marina]MBL6449342.1 thioesterase [Fulvivirga marina]